MSSPTALSSRLDRSLIMATVSLASLLLMIETRAYAQKGAQGGRPIGGGGIIAAPADASVVALAREMHVTVACAQQILALDADKNARTAAQKKIESSLIYAARMAAGQECAPGVRTLDTGVTPDAEGLVAVSIDTTSPELTTQEIASIGGVTTTPGTSLPVRTPVAQKIAPVDGIVTPRSITTLLARVPLARVESLAGYSDVLGIHLYMPPQTAGQTARRTGTRPFLGALVPLLPKKRSAAEKRRALLNLISTIGGRSNPVPDMLRDTLTLSAIGAIDYNGVDTGVIGEGVATHDIAKAYGNYGVSGYNAALGRPLRIGVMSDGDNFLTTSINSKDLSPLDTSTYGTGATASTTVAIDDTQNPAAAQDGAAGNTGEGTAMMEIVHDMAPDAKIFFASAFPSQQQFAKNIMLLRFKYHCDIICDDVYYYAEAPFSDDTVAQAVNQVTADGCMYFALASNFGHLSPNSYPTAGSGYPNYGTSSAWEGDFVDGGTVTAIGSNTVVGSLHAFNTGQRTPYNYAYGQLFNRAEYANGPYIFLDWSDPAINSSNDYDLYCTNSAGTTTTAVGNSTQTGLSSSYPYEYISKPGFGSRLYVLKKSTSAVRALHLNTFGAYYNNYPALDFSTNGQTYGHSGNLNGFGIAAAPITSARGGPYPSAFNAGSLSEFFSSDGPRTIFYTTSGGPNVPVAVIPSYTFPHSAPTFSAVGSAPTFAAGGVVRLQPLLTAADGVTASSAFNGSSLQPFYGTSAATPHAAAVCGLVMSYSSSNSGVTGVPGLSINGGLLSVSDMHTVLQNSALDIEAAGYDPTTGYGIVMPAPAIAYLNGFLSSSPVAASTSATGETIAWTTRLPASTVVNYGTTPLLGTTYTGAAGATSHTATLSGLIPGTTYYYTITTGTATGSAAYTTPTAATFTTTATTPALALTGIALATSGGTTTATITVANNGSASSDVQVTAAKLGSGSTTTPLAKDLGAMAATASTTFTLTFPAVASGRTVLTLSLTDGTGAVNNFTQRVTAP